MNLICGGSCSRKYMGTLDLTKIGVRAGGRGGGGGDCSSLKILGNSDFLGSERNLGKAIL